MTRDMRMSMQHQIRLRHRLIRRNMDEMNSKTHLREFKCQRPFILVTIPPDHLQRLPGNPQLIQNPFAADIAQMPDLVSPGNSLHERVRKLVMGIRNNGYASRFVIRGLRAFQAPTLFQSLWIFQASICPSKFTSLVLQSDPNMH